MKDLVCLVADKSMESALQCLLERNKSFKIRKITFEIFVHPQRDPGVLKEAGNFLAPFYEQFHFALVLFDREGSGQEKRSAQELQPLVQKQLNNLWIDRSGVIVIDPELEAWVWTDSPHVSRVLGIEYQSLQELLKDDSTGNISKPSNPKNLMKGFLYKSRIPLSSSLFADLARNVSFKYCSDPAFCQLRDYLVKWFREDISVDKR